MKRLVVMFLLAALLLPAASLAQEAEEPDPAEFTPVGYEFCGWRDFEDGGWTYDVPDPGVYSLLFARDMSCQAARRNYNRVKYTKSPPYRPLRAGYRCKELRSAHEYSDVRCIKRGNRATFRYQTGA